MASLGDIIKLGKEIGLEGEDLRNFALTREQELKEEKQYERDERAREREREKEKAWKEMEMQNLERQRAYELEKLRLELEKAKLNEGGERLVKTESVCAPKFPKLPVFNDQIDSIDAYLLRFERFATSAGWDQDVWAVSLSSLLQGKALEAYQHLSPTEVKDYESVKGALLKCFQCTAEGYRSRFRNAKFFKGESGMQFGNRLKNYLKRWIDLSGGEKSYDGLMDLVLMEQYMNACDKSMILFLKEHEVKNFEDLIKYAELYVEAHGNPSKKFVEREVRVVKEMSHIESKVQDASSAGVSGVHKGQFRKCFVCGGSNHLSRDCFYKYGAKPKDRSAKGKGESMAAFAAKHGRLNVARGEVEGVAVNVLRDQGCDTVLVKTSLVPRCRFTGRHVSVKMANGMIFTYPEANVRVKCPFYVGGTLAACLENPVYDLVIGQVEGVRDGETVKLGAVTTRQQEKQSKIKLAPKLKVKEVLAEMKDNNLAEQQKYDVTLNNIRKYAESKRRFQKSDNEYHEFIVKKGILYRRVVHADNVTEQLVVPSESRNAVMEIAHSSLMSGHLGIKKTLTRIQNKFFWPGMSSEVARFCRSCDPCQRTVDKGRVSRAKLGRMPMITEPFQRVAVDIVGPIEPRADDGSRYILTIVDYATRYPEAIPLKNVETVSVAEALMSVFSRVGIPKEIMSDKGSQFRSDVMKEFNRLLSIKGISTTPYHAMCNGLVERFNGVLKKMLKRMCAEQPKQWPRYIAPLLFAYRDVPQASTKFSPFELIYGHTVRGPLSLLKDLWEASERNITDETRTAYEYVINLRERLAETCKVAQEELQKAGDSYQYYYDRKAKDRYLKEGDKALLLLPTNSNKLLMHWRGPFTVVKKINKWNYMINVNGVDKKFHINMLKRYYERGECETERTADDVMVDGDEGVTVASVAVIHNEESDADVDVVPNYVQTEDVNDVHVNDDLTERQKTDVRGILNKFKSIFTDVPGKTNVIEHKVKLCEEKPIRSKPYPVPFALQKGIEEEIERMLRLGLVEYSMSPYSTPMIAVKKKDGSNRLCLDFRKINKITVFDAEPMPNQDAIMAKISHSKYFSKIDLSKGYWQLPLDKDSRKVTAFQTSKGLLQFTVMPFGLVNASATFNRLMRILFSDVANVETFVDDILIHTDNWQDHIITLECVLAILKDAGLTARPCKTEIGKSSIEYLGHCVGSGTSSTTGDKIKRVLNMAVPRTKKEVRSFLGLTGYYRQYIADYATIASPLTDLTRKSVPNKVSWEICHQDAFDRLRNALASKPILKLPDMNREFIVQTDASDIGLGAVLLQVWENERWPVMYASRKLKTEERNYSIIEKECLAIIWSLKKFYQYLYGRHFVIETDHQPLKYLQTSCQLNARLMRWAIYLQQFRFSVRNIKGVDNVGADCLSRLGH